MNISSKHFFKRVSTLAFYKIIKLLNLILYLPLYFLFFPVIILIRLISPFIIIRFGSLVSSRIGHLAANTELYLCERDARINTPKKPFIDVFYPKHFPVCNKYLLKKWRKYIYIWPKLIIHPLAVLNDIIPFGNLHSIHNKSNNDRDINNLLDRFPAHITFTKKEEEFGKKNLKLMGIANDSKFVCLLVRDNAYLKKQIKNIDWSYHNYRDCNIDNYFLAADELTKRGYFVIRMGVEVNSYFNNGNPMIIDYANNGMRSEFLDIYLGANCEFCISTSSGWDAIPLIFRKPIIFAPIVPIGYMFTFSNKFYAITKHHFDVEKNRNLTLSEIFEKNLGFALSTDEYEKNKVKLIENKKEEILDLVIEFVDRNNGLWKEDQNDNYLQDIFWEKFPINSIDSNGLKLHGEIRSKFGTRFLNENKEWLK